MAVTSKTKLVWVIFRECQKLLCINISSEGERDCMHKLCEISIALWK